jgi:hypothetical protein
MKRVMAWMAMLLSLSVGAADTKPLKTPPEHIRGTEQTYLTFPEWFLVFSPDEYATFTENGRPSDFPFWGHIGQFWSSYRTVAHAANDGYPFNFGYHVMITVIGVSTTAEYALRSAYETLVGRVAEATAGGADSEEDRFAAQVAREYVDFIVVNPWYDFDFTRRLRALWTEVPATGPHMARKWERRYALTTEYGIKAAYGWLIRKATHASYDAPVLSTAVVVQDLPPRFPFVEGETFIARKGDETLVLLPRYQAFMRSATRLAKSGANFEEIAGNRSVILVSAIAPRDWQGAPGETFFVQPIITRPQEKRVVLRVRVEDLAERLRTLPASGVRLEHVFDY